MRKTSIFLLYMLAAVAVTAQDSLYINDFTINPGETKAVEIILDNANEFTALQADITLPEGLTIEQEDGEYVFVLTDRKANNHMISSTMLTSGALRILIASQTLKIFSGNSGALVVFHITADDTFYGPKAIEIKNIIASEVDRTEHRLDNTVCIVDTHQTKPNNRLYINDFSISAGSTRKVEIMLDNDTEFTALQADITLPEGLSIGQEDGEYLFDLTDRKARNHTISSTTLESGAIRLLIASQTLKTFKGNNGALVTFHIIADDTFSGPKTIEIKNIIASEVDRTEHTLPDTACTVNKESDTPPPTPLTLTTRMEKMQCGNTLQIVAEGVEGATWTSSDSTVATVDENGLVTALKPGLAAITVTTTSGETAWCAIFVYNPGDVNEDGVVSGADITALYNILLN